MPHACSYKDEAFNESYHKGVYDNEQSGVARGNIYDANAYVTRSAIRTFGHGLRLHVHNARQLSY